MKKISLFIPFLILTFAVSLLAGCDASKDPQWEASKKALVEEFLASAQGITHGDITVDSTKKSVTIANLKVEKNIVDEKGQNVLSLTVEADKLVATNVNFVDAPSGVIDIAEKTQLSNVKYTMVVDSAFLKRINLSLNGEDLASPAMVQEVVFEKIRDDAGLLLKTIAEKNIPVDQLIPLREKLHIASVSAKNMSSMQKIDPRVLAFDIFNISADKADTKMKMTAGALSFKDFSIEGLHDYLLTDYTGEIEGKKIFSLESFAIKNIVAPHFAANILANDIKKLLSQDLSIEGVDYKNIRIFPVVGEITLKGIEGNFIKKAGQLTFNGAYKNLIIPSELLDYVSQKSGSGKFSELYNKPLDLTTKADIKGTVDDNGNAKVTVSTLELNDANLGAFNLQFGLEGKNFTVDPDIFPPLDISHIEINSAKVLFQDKGVVDLGFAFAAMEQNNSPLGEAKESGRAMRTLSAGIFSGICTRSIGTVNKPFCDEVAKIVKNQGSLELVFQPKSPLPLDTALLSITKNLQEAGVTVKYTK